MSNFQSHLTISGQSSQPQLPKFVVAMTLNQGSVVTCMDFHPLQHTLLLVGTNTGELTIWNLRTREKLVDKNFMIRTFADLPISLKASLRNDGPPSVTHVKWSPDGTLLGVAYSKTLVHIYSYHGGDNMELHFEIKAHKGTVTDLAFSNTNSIVTCGDDKSIKVWNQRSKKLKFFNDHEAQRFNENNQFGFSTAIDGKMKLWSYLFSRVDYDEPRLSSTRMACSADATRLFSSGRNHDGSPYLVEWNESNCTVKHTYTGLVIRAPTMGVVHVDTLNDRFIAIGDDHLVKFWDMDNPNLWTTVDAEGGLPASPCLKSNTQGTLLGVSTFERGIKILSNPDGMKLLEMNEARSSSGFVFKLFGQTIIPNTPPV